MTFHSSTRLLGLVVPLALMMTCSPLQAAGESTTGPSVAYVSIRSGDAHIYTRSADGLERMLTQGKGVNTQPAWSGRGLLAYAGRVGPINKIHLVDEDGSGRRIVNSDERNESSPSWSPDGNSLAYFSIDMANGGGQLRIASLADAKSVVVEARGKSLGPAAVSWSADGQRLAFIGTDEEGRDQAWVVQRDGTGLRELSSKVTKRGAGSVSLSPDGRQVAWIGDLRGTLPIIVTDVDSGGSRQLTAGSTASHESPRWSPDGRYIVFASNRDPLDGGRNDIFVMDADGGNVRNLSRHPSEDFDPKWSPDGRRVVFASLRTGTSLLYEVDLVSGSTRPLATHSSHDMDHVVRPLAALR